MCNPNLYLFILNKHKAVNSVPTAAPTSLSISSYGGTYLGIDWISPSDLTVFDFMIHYRVNGSSQLSTNVSTGSYSTSFLFTELEPNTIYEITVAAGNAIGFGPESAPIFAKTRNFREKLKKIVPFFSLPLHVFTLLFQKNFFLI